MDIEAHSLAELDAVYKEAILDLYRNPLNKKILADFDVQARQVNPACGDDITVQLKFDAREEQDQNTVADVGHSGQGCAISQAAISLLTDHIKTKTLEQIRAITEKEMLELLQIPINYTRMKCALLGWTTLQLITKITRTDFKNNFEMDSKH